KMLKIGELKVEIDSLSTNFNENKQSLKKVVHSQMGFDQLEERENTEKSRSRSLTIVDSITFGNGPILERFDHRNQSQILNIAMNTMNRTIATLGAKKAQFKKEEDLLNKFIISLHDKYVIAAACIILFFVGAPLGAIIRKGGMGLPLVVAVLL